MSKVEEAYSKVLMSIVTEDLFRKDRFSSLFELVEKGNVIDMPAQEALDLIRFNKKVYKDRSDLTLSIFLLDDIADVDKIKECFNTIYGYDVFEKYPKSLGAICNRSCQRIAEKAKRLHGLTHTDDRLSKCLIFVKKNSMWKDTLIHEMIHFVQNATKTNYLRLNQLASIDKEENPEIPDNLKIHNSFEAVPYFNGICFLLEKIKADTHEKAMIVIKNLIEIAGQTSSYAEFKDKAKKKSIFYKLLRAYVRKTGDKTFDASIKILLECIYFKSHVNTIKTYVGSYFID